MVEVHIGQARRINSKQATPKFGNRTYIAPQVERFSLSTVSCLMKKNTYSVHSAPRAKRVVNKNKMKCVVCKGSDIDLKTVDEQIKSEKDIILVPMNILVCSTCGERYYDRKSMRKIEEIRKKLKNKKLDVEEVGKVMRANAA